MEKIYEVLKVRAFTLTMGHSEPQLVVGVVGQASTPRWTGLTLAGRVYVTPPADGVWDFDLMGTRPGGIVPEVLTAVTASTIEEAPAWLKGVRVHAASNSLEAPLERC